MTTRLPDSDPPIENYDPLARLLTQTLRLSPFTYGLLIFVADLIVDGWLGWRYGVFLTKSGTPGLLQDLTAISVDFVLNPVLCGLYLWTAAGTTELFGQLRESGIFERDSVLGDIVDRSRTLYRSRLVFYVILGLAVLFTVAETGAHLAWVPWKTSGGYLDLYPTMSFARAPFWFLTAYALCYGTFNVAVTIAILRRLFRTEKIQLRPLHPDRCGGLGSISQYTVKIGYAIGAIGLVISAATVYELRQGTLLLAFSVLGGIVAYLVFAPLFFFWPLGTAHEAMRAVKNAELLRLARQFDDVYERVTHGLLDQGDDYTQELKKLEHLRQLYHIAQEFPVWPFDVRNLRRFFTVVATPLVPALISIVSELAKSIFLP